jgi:cytochrome b561
MLVTLHWLLAALLLLALVMGSQWLAAMPNSSPEKIGALRGHMLVGLAILALTLLRFGVRLATRHPPRQVPSAGWTDTLARVAHVALYLLVIVMGASGIGMSLQAGLPDIVFGGIGALPASFQGLTPRIVHGIASKLLAAFIVLHVAGALFHAVVRRDGLLARMGYGRRWA